MIDARPVWSARRDVFATTIPGGPTTRGFELGFGTDMPNRLTVGRWSRAGRMNLLTWIWLGLSASIAGAVNSLAGGGTLLTFPTLLAALASLGSAEAAVVANMTSTVALVPGSMAGAWGYRRELGAVRAWLVLLAAPSLLGGWIGALLVSRVDPRYFAVLVPWLTLTAATLFLLQPRLPYKRTEEATLELPSLAGRVGIVGFQFLVGVYGGYFGAGIGILMLGALAVMGLKDVHQMNALKTVLAALINGVSVLVFATSGRVHWPYAGVMALAAIVGGYLGAHGSRYLPRSVVRWFVIAVGFGLSAYFFWKQASSQT